MRTGLKTGLLLVAGTLLGFALSVGSGVMAQRDAQPQTLPWDEARLLAEVLERVRQEYVEPVTDSQLIESAVRGMVTDLDPHSQFLDIDEYEEIRINTSGNYSGVGLEVNMDDNQVVVVAPIDDSPAARAGILPGDQIIAIDDVQITAANINDTVSLMRGKPGTRVKLAVSRSTVPSEMTFTLERSHVTVRSVKARLLEPDYGYLRITHFSDTTYSDAKRALRELEKDNRDPLKGLLLDLRNNPGGVLEAAVELSDAFLDDGIIVTANGRAPDASFTHEAEQGDLLEGARIVVLVNGGSASASEIVAGALQSNKRATIAGTQTFGKGSVQTVIPISSGRAIKLTTSRYYTPSGVSIHGKGITPDQLLTDDPQANLKAGVATHHTDKVMAMLQTDAQLQAAVSLLKETPQNLQTGPRVAQVQAVAAP